MYSVLFNKTTEYSSEGVGWKDEGRNERENIGDKIENVVQFNAFPHLILNTCPDNQSKG